MKKLVLLLGLLVHLSGIWAQQAQQVLPYSRVQHPMSWYREQATAWRKQVDKDPREATAWYNLYYAQRLLSFHDAGDKRSWEQKQQEMDRLLAEMKKNVPGSYEYNLVMWMVGGLDLDKLPYLQKANELGPGRTEHLDHMINVAEIQGRTKDRNKYAKKKWEAGDVSAGMLYYNYNVLAGLDSNAMLLVVGDNDTYPAWVLQSMGIRTDVTILNLSLLLADDYRKNIFRELGVQNTTVNWNTDPENAEQDFYKKVPGLLSANSKKYPFYIALTASHIAGMAKPVIEDKLYLTGLAYMYSTLPIDNMAILKRNFEQRYTLDYLDKAFYLDISADLVKRINANYIVPMLKLYDHYVASADVQGQQRIKSRLLEISTGTQDEQDIIKHLSH